MSRQLESFKDKSHFALPEKVPFGVLLEKPQLFKELKESVDGYVVEVNKTQFDTRVKERLCGYLVEPITELEAEIREFKRKRDSPHQGEVFRGREYRLTGMDSDYGQLRVSGYIVNRKREEEFDLRVEHLKKVFLTHGDDKIQQDWFN
ncbi:TPA: hypothetical protein HA241_06985 [Candidatus Woesearchaeota archaeon]|nr:hypothetical protein [Candidatus Woesearchaeota archaeon]